MDQVIQQPKFSLKAGWICLSIATLSMLLLGPFLGSILAGPLIIASLILAIIGMAKNNVGGGVILLVLSFILPPIAMLLSLALSFSLYSAKPPKPAAITNPGELVRPQ